MITPTAGTAIRCYRAFLTTAEDPRPPWGHAWPSPRMYPRNAPF